MGIPAGDASRRRLPIVSRQPIDRLHALEHEASRSGSRVCIRETSAAAEHLLWRWSWAAEDVPVRRGDFDGRGDFDDLIKRW